MAPKKKPTYTEEDLLNALTEIRNGMPVATASKTFNVPRSTLMDKSKGRYEKGRPGPNTALSAGEEARIVAYLKGMSRIGHGISRKQLTVEVKNILDSSGIPRPNLKHFIDNKPSRGWAHRFMQRHDAEISARTPEHLGIQRAYVTEKSIRTWFTDLSNFLREEHDINAETFLSAENAHRIFNCDESGFPLAGSTSRKAKVLTPKGDKNVYSVGPDTKEQITVLGMVSADGSYNTPMVIHSGVRDNFSFNGVNRNDYRLGRSESGWITTDCFFEYIANNFYPEIKDKIEFPIILFFDGHTSHINLPLSEFCKAKNIIAYCFPPHASHIIQPLDVSVYGPLKAYYNESLRDRARIEDTTMTKNQFIEVFDKAWQKAKSKNLVPNGFRKCGLVPLNPDALDYNRLMGERHKTGTIKKQINVYEKLGIKRSIKIFEECLLSEELKDWFLTLIDEDKEYNDLDRPLTNEDPLTYIQLFRAYKKLHAIAKGDVFMEKAGGNDDPPADGNDGDDDDFVQPPEPFEVDDQLSGLASTQPLQGPLTAQTQDNNPLILDFTDVPPSHMEVDQQPVTEAEETQSLRVAPLDQPISQVISLPSTSHGAPQTSTSQRTFQPVIEFENYSLSPWKDNIRIPVKYIPSRKISKRKNRRPYAVSAVETHEYLSKKLHDKEEAEKKKTERKQMRESRARARSRGKDRPAPRRTRRQSSSSSTSAEEIEISEGSSEPEDEFDSLRNQCHACSSDQGESNDWVGCDKCAKWFHKNCLSHINFNEMTNEEVEEFDFVCKDCEKKKRRRKLIL